MLRMFAAAALTLASQAETSGGDPCAAAMAATGYRACAAAPSGIALAGTTERATALAMFAQAGEERFQLTFGRSPARYAVAELRPDDSLGDDQAKLKTLGYGIVLPWISHQQYADNLTASLRRAASEQAKAQRLDETGKTALFRTMLAAQAPQLSSFKRNESDAGTVPHELGHMWFGASWWPDRPKAEGRYYGTPGPDWLDETAAILMEGQELADGRRRTFTAVYHGRAKGAFAGVPVNELIDLPHFLSRTHPGLGMHAAEHAEQRKTGRTMIVLKTGPEAAKTARMAGMYYMTGRLFADYLIDRSGGLAIFPALATVTARGETLEAWLSRDGARFRLPGSIAALDADWRTWLTARFGAPGSAPAA